MTTLVLARRIGCYYVAHLVAGDAKRSVWSSWGREPMAAWAARFAAFTGLGVEWSDTIVDCAWTIADGASTPISPIAAAERPVEGIHAIGYLDPLRGNLMELVKGGGESLRIGTSYNRDWAETFLEDWRSLTGHGGEMVDVRYFPEALIDDRDRRRIFAAARSMDIPTDKLKEAIYGRFGLESTNHLTKRQASLVIYELLPSLGGGVVQLGNHGVPTAAVPIEELPHPAPTEPPAPDPVLDSTEPIYLDDPIRPEKKAKKPRKPKEAPQ